MEKKLYLFAAMRPFDFFVTYTFHGPVDQDEAFLEAQERFLSENELFRAEAAMGKIRFLINPVDTTKEWQYHIRLDTRINNQKAN